MTTARRYVILSFQVDSKYCLDMQLERHFPGNIPLNWYQARDTSLREMRVSGSREDFWTHLPEEAIYKALNLRRANRTSQIYIRGLAALLRITI